MFRFRFLSLAGMILAVTLCTTVTAPARAGDYDVPYYDNTSTPSYLVSTDWGRVGSVIRYSHDASSFRRDETLPYYDNTRTPSYLVSTDWGRVGGGISYGYRYAPSTPAYLSGTTRVTGSGGGASNDTITLSGYTSENKDAANIRIHVPADAKLWFDDYQTRQTGEMRTYTTPELPVDKISSYNIRVRWTEHGAAKEEVRHVDVRGGQQMDISFPNPEKLSKAGK